MAATAEQQANFVWLGGLMGWMYLPNFVASLIQTIWYGTMTEKKRPFKDSPLYRRHYARILTSVVVVYLIYGIIQYEASLGENHYDRLDLTFSTFTMKQLKSNFRKASLMYHPDKIGQAGADIFVKIRASHDVLVDPALRAAYDRFGDKGASCTTCKTSKEYFDNGLRTTLTFYGASFTFLFLLGMIGRASYGKYWRYWGLFAMFMWELGMVLGPKQSSVLEYLYPRRTTFQQLSIAHHIYISLFAALSCLGPVLLPTATQKSMNTVSDMIAKLSEHTETLDEKSTEQLEKALEVFNTNPEYMHQLKRQMSTIIVESLIAQHSQPFDDTRMAIYKRIKNPPKGDTFGPKKKKALERLENI
ncbi:hypothetical protein BGZ94_007513 [Podila epigama]|nr:hypothetical protein BGZ94_007513 [Podila epigama]